MVKYAEWKKYNRHFWVREYYCETIGDVNEETIKRYIREHRKDSYGRRFREVTESRF